MRDFSENDGEAGGKASLPEQVKGKVDKAGADFKPLSHPDGQGQGDDQAFPGFGQVKPGAEVPGEPRGLKKS